MKTTLNFFLLTSFGCWFFLFPTKLFAEVASNTAQTAILIDANGEITGNLALGVELWYQVTLPDDGQWTIDYKGSNNLQCNSLQLYDMSEKLIITGSYGITATVTTPNLQKGQYLLKLRYYTGTVGAFTIKSSFVNARLANDAEPNNEVGDANTLAINSTTTGRLYYRKTDGSFDSADWYKITTTKSGKLRVNFLGDESLRSNSLKLYDTNKTTLLVTGSWGVQASVSKDNLLPGTYYVCVPRYDGYGSYELSSVFTEANLVDDIEPNDVQENAQTIYLSDSIFARIGYGTGAQVDKSDWYKVSISENGSLKFSFFSDNTLKINNPKIYTENGILRNSAPVWGTNFNFIISDLAKGDYWIYVPQYDGYGAYKFIVEFTAFNFSDDKEPNNTFSHSKELLNEQTVSGNLGQYHTATDRDLQDWYKIVVPENAAIEFTFLTDSILQINNPVLYATNNDTITLRNTSPNWKYNFKFSVNDLAAGTYYLKVPRYDYYGAYKLAYKLIPLLLKNDVESNDNFRTAILLNDKDAVTGHMGYWRQTSADKDIVDWYKIVIPDNAAIEFTFLTDSLLQINSPVLYATNNDTISLRNTNSTWRYNFKFNLKDLAAGTYYLKVPYYDYYGAYKLTYKLMPPLLTNDVEPNNNFRTAILLKNKDVVTGHLGFWRQTAGDKDTQDWYKIVLTENAAIDLTFLSDSTLQINNPVLYTADNDTIKLRNTCSVWKYNFQFKQSDLSPGTYYIKVPRYDSFGTYTLSYKEKIYTLGFEVAKYNNDIKIVNKSNADSFEWNFGDGTTSKAQFPAHSYTQFGDFEIVQKMKITGSSTFWIAKDTVSIAGIESYLPKAAGNGGDMIMTVYGGGLDENTQIKLIQGSTTLLPEKILKKRLGMVEVVFDLHYADAGDYDVSIQMGSVDPVIFEKGLMVEGIQYPHVASSIEGYGTLRSGRLWKYNMLLTNTGNVLARGVSAYIIVPNNVEFSSDLPTFSSEIDTTKTFDYYDEELNQDFSVSNVKVKATMDALRIDYIELDSLFGTPFKGKAYFVYVPLIQAGSTLKVPFKVKSLSTASSDVSSIQSFVLPINMFGSCGSPMSYEMQNKMVDVLLASLEDLPIVDKNPYFKTFVKVANIGKSAIRNAASYFGYLSAGMSDEEAFHEAYISEGQLDKSNAEVIAGVKDWAQDMALDKLKGLSAEKLAKYSKDRAYYIKKALQENKAGDDFGLQLFSGFSKDIYDRMKRVEELRNMLNGAESLSDANDIIKDASEILDIYAKDCPEMAKLLNTYKKYFKDFSGRDNLKKKPLSIGTSVDPNDIAGPLGYLSDRFIDDSQQMDYLIRFENKATAPLAAQIVNVYDTLDVAKYDLSTFELSDINIAGNTIQIPRGRSTFLTNYDMRPAKNLLVSIAAKLDTITGIVNWQFVTLDPITKEITDDPELGFLTPNITAPEGEGSVSFTVKLKAELANNTTIRNRADIIFDYNDPILTNIWNNKIDNQAPNGAIAALTQLNDSIFRVECNGADSGSGVRYYKLYCSTNNSEFEDIGDIYSNSVVLKGKLGNTYGFCVVPVDSVGNSQIKQIVSESSITLAPNKINELTKKVNFNIFPNPSKDFVKIQLIEAPFVGSYVIQLIGLNGSMVMTKIVENGQIRSGVQLSVGHLPSGRYLLRMLYGNESSSQKIVIE